jgi:hypothetical protein
MSAPPVIVDSMGLFGRLAFSDGKLILARLCLPTVEETNVTPLVVPLPGARQNFVFESDGGWSIAISLLFHWGEPNSRLFADESRCRREPDLRVRDRLEVITASPSVAWFVQWRRSQARNDWHQTAYVYSSSFLQNGVSSRPF